MLAEGSIVPDTRLVLANAIYFKGDWLFPFATENTKLEPFFLLDGSQVEADQMAFSKPVTIPYYAGDGFQVVELPYQGEAFNMLVLVPDEGQFAAVEPGLDADFFEAVLSQLQAQSVSLNMPKFTFDSSFELKDTLSEMGMLAAFENADFSGITGDRSLAIGQVFHNAFVSVDEKGTEAAAATVVVMVETALIPAVSLTIDRPFMFFILHKPTGSLVFAGRLLDPR
jgi:serpin B